ncbi:MAG: GGDEF domain-containing phosphodiesterase, partial [Halioglobus sp.]|nr:GGDEF domain-containing phosphodiesterase [Halioglobus sp.]
ALQLCNKIRRAIRDLKYISRDQVFGVTASIGVTVVDDAIDSMSDLLNAADTACKFVKDSGRDNVHVFHVGDDVLEKRRSEISAVQRLTSALEENRLVLFRQSIVPLRSGLGGKKHYELLVRMRTPEGMLVGPEEFLPLAERYDLASRLDKSVISNALEWFTANPDELETLDMCAINLSGQSLGSSDFREFVADKLRVTAFPAHKLCFEITETAAVTHLGAAIDLVEELKAFGCRFALDDFGSGLSSFGYLKALPVDIIKIDGTFVRDMAEDDINFVTVKSIADIAKALGLETIAEFVEHGDIVEQLMSIGVDYAQGYHFGRPSLFIDPQRKSLRRSIPGNVMPINRAGALPTPG